MASTMEQVNFKFVFNFHFNSYMGLVATAVNNTALDLGAQLMKKSQTPRQQEGELLFNTS